MKFEIPRMLQRSSKQFASAFQIMLVKNSSMAWYPYTEVNTSAAGSEGFQPSDNDIKKNVCIIKLLHEVEASNELVALHSKLERFLYYDREIGF